jgi:hypothetical protein
VLDLLNVRTLAAPPKDVTVGRDVEEPTATIRRSNPGPFVPTPPLSAGLLNWT